MYMELNSGAIRYKYISYVEKATHGSLPTSISAFPCHQQQSLVRKNSRSTSLLNASLYWTLLWGNTDLVTACTAKRYSILTTILNNNSAFCSYRAFCYFNTHTHSYITRTQYYYYKMKTVIVHDQNIPV